MHRKIKVGFFRGVNFSSPIGESDWRIALCFDFSLFEVWVFGRKEDKLSRIGYPEINIIAPYVRMLPLVSTLSLSHKYLLEALRSNLDIIICHPYLMIVGIFLKLLRPKTKIILDIRSIPVENYGFYGWAYQRIFDLAFKFKFYDAVSVITEKMLQDLDDQFHFKSRVPTVVWESGFDDQLFRPLTKETSVASKPFWGEFNVIFHGTFSVTRGLQNMVRAVQILREEYQLYIKLILIGRGPAEHELKKLVVDLNLQDQIIILPPMMQEALPEYLAFADLGIDLLPEFPWWVDQSPLKVYEFLGMGIPVLASDITCHHNISSAVLLIKEPTPRLIADRIKQLIISEDLPNLKQTALLDSKGFTWKERAKVLENFLLDYML